MTQSQPRVMMAVPNTGRILAETERSLLAIMTTSATADHIEFREMVCFPVEVARQRLVDSFLADPLLTHLFFVDSDMGLPADTLERLLRLDRPIACLPCPRFAPRAPGSKTTSTGVTSNVWMLHSPLETPAAERIVRFLEPDEFPAEPFECDGTGLACCLIRRDVFEHMDRPMFAFTLNDGCTELRISEDSHFFAKARELGYAITVDPGAMCDHYKEVDLTHMEELFSDEPIRWTWNVGARPDPSVPVFIACIAGPAPLHSETVRFLSKQVNRPDRLCEVFTAEEWSESLKMGVRHFLGRRREQWLFLLDPRTVPPEDFLDRALGEPHPAATGAFRELANGAPRYGAFIRNEAGSLGPVTNDDVRSAIPSDVDAFSLRAALLQRDVLAPMGSSWIRAGTTPLAAGVELAKALRSRQGVALRLLPIGCRHYEAIGLRSLLDAKSRLRAEMRMDQ